jgi:hypothetical protein
LQSLISCHVSLQRQLDWQESLRASGTKAPVLCLQRLDFRDNDLSYTIIRDISDDLIDLPLESVDFRGNPGISSEIISELARQMPTTVFRTGISAPIKTRRDPRSHRAIRPQIQLRAKGRAKSESRIVRGIEARPTEKKLKVKSGATAEALLMENARLKALLSQLESGSQLIEIEPHLAIVGPRAEELRDHLVRLDGLLRELNLGVPAFLSKPQKVDKRASGRLSARKRTRKTALG